MTDFTKMEKMEIYTSRKKSIFLLLGSLLFVIGGIYMTLNFENFKNPLFTKFMGVICTLFFSLGIYVSLRQIISNRIILIIDKTGLNVNPEKLEVIKWENVEGFSEIEIYRTKILLIHVNNPKFWIEKEDNIIRKKMMQFNNENYGSPFNLSANSMQIDHFKLLTILNESLTEYKYNA